MRLPLVSAAVVLAVAAALSFARPSPQADSSAAMAEMMKSAARFTQLGENHKVLAKFLGKWTTETRFFMGEQAGPPSAGTAEFSWLMEGRWLQSRGEGSMMNMPVKVFYLLGYDNFKQSFVSTGVSSLDTAMTRVEGDLTQDGKTLLCYGTIDEYLTGEHDKMVKYVWRFVSEDTIVFECHDLPIGETNTKVLEIKYTRAK